ncbi:PfkB family carbohydrate kinase [Chachezhania antarctica]|uniref:PfkB family carbohydrate kinase n=1 Tax=Chachezhania antarctica TaxID=2340860 RepID=UPI0013CEDE1B|nr:pyridoxal kinase [Chachezhania antarctica]|tara:strand:- start:7070 stop:7888 length:819 start_codon:yes stop_codon:yes gene_type:complete
MSRVLALSSWVSYGHVGLSAAGPALQALGHTVTQLPTIVLSNHPGWPHVSGRQVPVEQLDAMVGALDDNGWLDGHDAFFTGYLPSPDHVDLAVRIIDRLRASGGRPRITVDPVLGDDPKGLYLPEPAAIALRDRLVPLADTLTPNRFELGWLTGLPADTGPQAIDAARGLARAYGSQVIVTSPPSPFGRTGALAVTARTAQRWTLPLGQGVPHGVGDVFAGLIASGLPVAEALGHLSALIAASLGAPHLRIAETAAGWTGAAPATPDPIQEF